MTVGEKIRNGEYENKQKYPNKADFKIRKVCKECGSIYTDVEEKNYIHKLLKNIVKKFKN